MNRFYALVENLKHIGNDSLQMVLGVAYMESYLCACMQGKKNGNL